MGTDDGPPKRPSTMRSRGTSMVDIESGLSSSTRWPPPACRASRSMSVTDLKSVPSFPDSVVLGASRYQTAMA